jgi:hypothetical protein
MRGAHALRQTAIASWDARSRRLTRVTPQRGRMVQPHRGTSILSTTR